MGLGFFEGICAFSCYIVSVGKHWHGYPSHASWKRVTHFDSYSFAANCLVGAAAGLAVVVPFVHRKTCICCLPAFFTTNVNLQVASKSHLVYIEYYKRSLCGVLVIYRTSKEANHEP